MQFESQQIKKIIETHRSELLYSSRLAYSLHMQFLFFFDVYLRKKRAKIKKNENKPREEESQSKKRERERFFIVI